MSPSSFGGREREDIPGHTDGNHQDQQIDRPMGIQEEEGGKSGTPHDRHRHDLTVQGNGFFFEETTHIPPEIGIAHDTGIQAVGASQIEPAGQ